MESRFPAILVLWLGREFYRGKYEMTDSSQVWTPDFGDKLGDEIWDLEGSNVIENSWSKLEKAFHERYMTSKEDLTYLLGEESPKFRLKQPLVESVAVNCDVDERICK
ncbi:hypothetical protein AVEN_249966-1 [Araneus ventricosus]|uniref:Uncharacterized protein n=1 Tax=Araneus ventricosus TaxID=182803 RepID=A0A4Y2M256_ARAVE|nr:hypothetical protein AVEN_249966-1 [Araneus ventricosus]